jgi:putative ABC transport system ATP-binding protein
VGRPSQPLIELEGIGKVFPAAEVDTHALAEVHLTIRRGEFVCIEGPSGCGKTTLLSILGLLDEPTRGEYRLEGEPVARLAPAQRAAIRNRKIGFIFQSFNLIGDLTIAENIELPLTYRGWTAQRRRQRVAEALDKVGLAHRARHMPGQLSGGQQQRVAVARAIAGEPRVLLADEPTGNLDSGNGEAVMEILRDIHAAGATIAMVTHNPDYARQAERRVSLFDGRIVEEQGREAA